MFHKTAFAAEIPVSQGKSAVASTVTGATYGANQAVDGFIGTKWLASSTQLPQWLTVDLAQSVHISRVETVFEHVGSSYAYKLETSTDGINWQMFADRSSNTAVNFPFYTDTGDASARFIRLTVVGVGSPGDRAGVYDLRVYSANNPLALLSQTKTTAAYSSFSNAWGSDKAVDGQLTTSWAPSTTSLPQWLIVDIGQLRNVQRFETTYANPNDAYGYKIDFSIDGLTWYTFADRTGNLQQAEPRYVDEGNVTARYFRLTTTSAESGLYANVAEFQVYGVNDSLSPGTTSYHHLALNAASYAVGAGDTSSVMLSGVYANGSSQSISSGATFTIADTSVATVSASGVVTGVSLGTTTLTVSYNGLTTTATISVTSTLSNINRIAFDSYAYSLQAGSSRYPYVVAYKSDGSTQTLTTGLSFGSSNTSIAAISTNGTITGINVGVATITVSYGNFTASATVTITSQVSWLEASESSVTMSKGTSRSLYIHAYDNQDNMTDVTSGATLTSSNTSVVSVGSNGYITAVAAGTATLTATYSGASTTIYVTVQMVDNQAPTWNYGSTLTVTVDTENAATLSWTAASDNVGVTSYRIYRDTDLLTTVSGSELSTQLSELTAGSTMHFRVEAGDLANNWSQNGPTAEYTVAGKMLLPTGSPTLNLTAQVERVSGPDGHMRSSVTISEAELSGAISSLNSGRTTTLSVQMQDYQDTSVVTLPSSWLYSLQDTGDRANLQVNLNDVKFTIPLRVFKSHISQAAARDGLFQVYIRHEAGEIGAAIASYVSETGGTLLLSNPVEFQLRAGGSDIAKYGSYVERSIVLPGSSYSGNTTAARTEGDTGKLTFVPSVLTNENGQTMIVIKDQFGGLYTIIQADKAFQDMQTHWAKTDVEKLAAKDIVAGVDEQHFAPEKEVSRAEFAALLARAMGLLATAGEAAAAFSDIQAGDWFAGPVALASTAGLIDGYDDGTFRPLDQVTREQMAVMIQRSMQMAGHAVEPSNQEAVLEPFSDQNTIDGWAREAIAGTLERGLMQGVTETNLNPHANATRAQAAVTLSRLLVYLNFMN
ncbi:S-layer homology domain-containing protein [Paenibacillus whitsoniae]|uniref:Uncharacterized protein n=1 Tax=Paenibacillus whitsoniae TaxID=2496558 RepID=A0A3S0BQ63_9BACL|nr:S-layer homology domain-containing protein [Paenibacillus whitsoniae]RTE01410.1 hypothetical protein EJQ19_30920 [Paenibacillus whitsoniae]